MSKNQCCTPQATQKLPGVQSPSQGKAKGAVRPTWDAYQGARGEKADPSPRKPGQ